MIERLETPRWRDTLPDGSPRLGWEGKQTRTYDSERDNMEIPALQRSVRQNNKGS